MKKKVIKKWVTWIIKYLLPVVIGWLEGDTHVISDGLAAIVATL
jgi:mannitol-specific phosphotransferase system IIBC component